VQGSQKSPTSQRSWGFSSNSKKVDLLTVLAIMSYGLKYLRGNMSELAQILNSIAELKTDVDSLKTDVDTKIDAFSKQNDTFNDKFDNYQKATQSIVNLSFGLIASATIITLAQGLFYRR
jgi:ABC-type transporter Mla subunit MlaD